MNKKTLQVLAVSFMGILILSWGMLILSFSRGWMTVHPSDAAAARIILPIVILFCLLFLFLAIGIGIYVYQDSKRRGMEPLLWTILVIIVPYFLGLIIYLIARKPLQVSCPNCGAAAPEPAAFCPACGQRIHRSCPKCQTALPNGGRFCHACGTELANT